MGSEPFFVREGDQFVPRDPSRGPWDRESLHGRVTAGLIAHAVERDFGDPDFHPARLTVDMFRLAKYAPVEIATRAVREGNRIRVVDATMTSEGREVARGSVVLLRRSEQPPGEVWSPPAWQVPDPEEIEPQTPRGGGYVPTWETRNINGGFGTVAQKRVWLRENRPFIDGDRPSPFVAVALASDFANPLANSGSEGLNFINADVTLYLHRLPDDEWLGFEVTAHHSHDGVAVAECALYDRSRAIGRSVVCALAQIQRR